MKDINERIVPNLPELSLTYKSFNISLENCNIRSKHFHKEFEIMKIDDGELWFCSDSHKQLLSKGDIIFINSYYIHEFKAASNSCQASYFQFDLGPYIGKLIKEDNEYLYRFIHNNYANKFKVFSKSNEIVSIVDGIAKELNDKNEFYEMQIKAYIYQLIVYLFRYKFLLDSDTHLENKEILKLLPAIMFINNNIDKKLLLSDVCNQLHIDKYYFCKIFKQITGSTFTEYVNFVRMYKAEQMLIHSDVNISQIAFECGFSSMQYFNKLFKKFHGFTPSHYKKYYIN